MLFSIITVSLNAQDTIADTINSVLMQDFDDYEIIVKDGCSTDNTVKMIPDSCKIRVIVEKDTGIYNAMNQAIKEARGDFLLFLNCGDTLYSNDVLSSVAKIAESQSDRNCIIYGNIYQTLYGEYKYPSKVKKGRFYFSSLPHQASYFGKDVFERVGLYDETMRIAADRAYFLDCKIKKVRFAYLDKTLCKFVNGGVSETPKGREIARQEMKKVIRSRYNVFERIFFAFVRSRLGRFLVNIRAKFLGK